MSEFQRLIDAYLDGELTEADQARLWQWLEEDDARMREFARQAQLHGLLRYKLLGQSRAARVLAEVGASIEETSTPAVPRSPMLGFLAGSGQRALRFVSRPTPMSLAIAVIVTPLLVVGLLLLISPGWFQREHGEPVIAVDGSRAVARITGVHRATWSSDSARFEVRKSLPIAQRLELESGLVEITFADGAKAVVEGPAEFLIDSGNSATLKHGRLTAIVPAAASGFAVLTPTAKVVDRGTEFGVDVDLDGGVEVVVFAGSVEFGLKDDAFAKSLLLRAGKAARVDGRPPRIISITSARRSFARALPDSAQSPLVRYGSFAADWVTTSASERTTNEIVNIINGKGLLATLEQANFNSVRHSVGFNPPEDRWVVGTDDEVTVSDITFAFRTPKDIDGILIWNYTQSGVEGRGVDTFDIEVDTGAGFFSIGSADIDPANESNHVAQLVSVPRQTGVRALRLTNVTNQGGDRIGLDEFRFRDSLSESGSGR